MGVCRTTLILLNIVDQRGKVREARLVQASSALMKSRRRVEGWPAPTDVIIHSGQKTVNRYVYPAGCNAPCRMLHSRKQKCPTGVRTFCLRVTRRVSRRVPLTSWNESRQEFTGDGRIDPFGLFEKSSPFVASTCRSWLEALTRRGRHRTWRRTFWNNNRVKNVGDSVVSLVISNNTGIW